MRTVTACLLLVLFVNAVVLCGEPANLSDCILAQMDGLTTVQMFEKGKALQAKGNHRAAAVCFMKLLLPGNSMLGLTVNFSSAYPKMTKAEYDKLSKEKKKQLEAPLRADAQKRKEIMLFLREGLDKCLESAGCKRKAVPDRMRRMARGRYLPGTFPDAVRVLPKLAEITRELEAAHIRDVEHFIELAQTRKGVDAVPVIEKERQVGRNKTEKVEEAAFESCRRQFRMCSGWYGKQGLPDLVIDVPGSVEASYKRLAETYIAKSDNANAQYVTGKIYYGLILSKAHLKKSAKSELKQARKAYLQYMKLSPKGAKASEVLKGLVYCASKAGDLQGAAKHLDELRGRFPKEYPPGRYFYELSRLLLETDNSSGGYSNNASMGREILEYILRKYPKSQEAHIAGMKLQAIRNKAKKAGGNLREFCREQMGGLTTLEMVEKCRKLQAQGKHKEAAACFLILLLPGNARIGMQASVMLFEEHGMTMTQYQSLPKPKRKKIQDVSRKKMIQVHEALKTGLDDCLEAAGCQKRELPEQVKKHFKGRQLPRVFTNVVEVIPGVARISADLDEAHIADVQYYINLAKTKEGDDAVPLYEYPQSGKQAGKRYCTEFYMRCYLYYSGNFREWNQKLGLKKAKEPGKVHEVYLELLRAYKGKLDNAYAQYAAGRIYFTFFVSNTGDKVRNAQQAKEALLNYVKLNPKGRERQEADRMLKHLNKEAREK